MNRGRITLKYTNGSKDAGVNCSTLVSVLTGCTSKIDLSKQLKKIEAIAAMKEAELPDIISDLSLFSSNSSLYNSIINNFPDFIVSTLPIYQCNNINGLVDPHELLDITHKQIEDGVSMITVHPTPNKKIMNLAQERLVPWTSRGGAIVMKDLITRNFNQDNVYLKNIDSIIQAAKKKKVVISIGASFRSANIFDSLDDCQIEEFRFQKEIADYIYERGVQVIIEGPGHSDPKKINTIAQYYQKMGYPIMPLGPIPTDTAIGQDHISSSIGAVLLGMHNCVDIVTSVTREEHTGFIPSTQSSIEAIQAAKIAAHIIDLNKLGSFHKDEVIAQHRAKNQTCVYDKNTSGCSRCAQQCPLRFEIA